MKLSFDFLRSAFALRSALAAAFGAALLSGGGAAHAQSASAPPAMGPDQAIQLSPFEVKTDTDVGYTAANSLMGGRINTALKDTPGSLTVITREFLDDILSVGPASVTEWAVNMAPNYENQKNVSLSYSYNPRNLGFSGGTYATRNYVLWYGLTDDYNTERYEFARGPSGTIYGDTNLGGIPTTWTKRAILGHEQTVFQTRADTYGGLRQTIDENYALNDKVAARINLLAFNNQDWYDVTPAKSRAVAFATTYRFTARDELRIDTEFQQYVHELYSHNNYDQGSFWDGKSVYNGVTAPATGVTTGLAKVPAGLIYIPGAGNGGLNDMSSFYTTTGTALSIHPTADNGVANFPVLPKRSFSLTPKDYTSGQHSYTYTGTWDHRFADNLSTELTFNRSIIDHENGKAQALYRNYRIDVNTVLPGSTPGTFIPNPNFGKAYDDEPISQQINNNNVTQFTGIAAWSFATRWLKESLSGMVGTRLDRFDVTQQRLDRIAGPGIVNVTAANGGGPNLSSTSNAVWVRRYWDDAGHPLGNDPVPVSGTTSGQTLAWEPQSAQYERKAVDFIQLASTNQFFNDKLTVMLGARRDQVHDSQDNTSGIAVDPTNGLPVIGAVLPSSTGALVGVPGAKIHTSTHANSYNGGFVYYVVPWIGLEANYAESIKASVAGSALLDGTAAPNPHNSGRDLGLRFNFLDGMISARAGFYTNHQKGNIISNTTQNVAEITEIQTHLAAANPSVAVATFPTTYTDTQDISGQGWEFEGTANPTRQIRLLFNYALPRSTTLSIRNQLAAYVNANLAKWQAAAATDPVIAKDVGTITDFFRSLTPGTPTNDTYKYLANIFGTYTFDQGFLKAFSIGGGVNFRGRDKVDSLLGSPYTFLYAKGYYLVTGTLSYSCRVSRKVDARFQINVTNLLDNDQLEASAQDAAAYGTYRVGNIATNPLIQVQSNFRQQDPRKATFSTTFTF